MPADHLNILAVFSPTIGTNPFLSSQWIFIGKGVFRSGRSQTPYSKQYELVAEA
jgi:hypothetical protein